MPIDPSFAVSGTDWQVGGLGGLDTGSAAETGAAGGSGFGGMLTQQLTNLSEMQGDAASASQELATGTAADTSTAVMAIERARLSMQLASQIRTKGVEALTEVLHTTI
jgi:flagellar hook-basal body complex protein FliE